MVYLISDITVHDPELYRNYVEQVPPIVERYGGRYLARGGEALPIGSDWKPERIILIEFPSMENIQRCLQSPEYQAIAPFRQRSTTSRAIIVQGI